MTSVFWIILSSITFWPFVYLILLFTKHCMTIVSPTTSLVFIFQRYKNRPARQLLFIKPTIFTFTFQHTIKQYTSWPTSQMLPVDTVRHALSIVLVIVFDLSLSEANHTNPNTSEESKEHSLKVLKELGDDASSGTHHEKDESHVLAGHKVRFIYLDRNRICVAQLCFLGCHRKSQRIWRGQRAFSSSPRRTRHQSIAGRSDQYADRIRQCSSWTQGMNGHCWFLSETCS